MKHLVNRFLTDLVLVGLFFVLVVLPHLLNQL